MSPSSEIYYFQRLCRLLAEEGVPKGGVRLCIVWSLFSGLIKDTVLDQPTVDNGEVSRGRSMAVAVGCLLLALQRQFNGKGRATSC